VLPSGLPDSARFEVARRYYERALSQLSQAQVNENEDPTGGYAGVTVRMALWRLSARETLERRVSELRNDSAQGELHCVFFPT
jgi:hypothetical protein